MSVILESNGNYYGIGSQYYNTETKAYNPISVGNYSYSRPVTGNWVANGGNDYGKDSTTGDTIYFYNRWSSSNIGCSGKIAGNERRFYLKLVTSGDPYMSYTFNTPMNINRINITLYGNCSGANFNDRTFYAYVTTTSGKQYSQSLALTSFYGYNYFTYYIPTIEKISNIKLLLSSGAYANSNYYLRGDFSFDYYTTLIDKYSAYAFNPADLTTPITVGDETFRPIDKFSNFRLLSTSDFDVTTTYDTDTTLIVSKNSFSADKILGQTSNSLEFVTNMPDDAVCKIAYSVDSGGNWLDVNGNNLNIEIPKTKYSQLSNEETIKWQNAKKVIMQSGMTIDEFKTVDWDSMRGQDIDIAWVTQTTDDATFKYINPITKE